MNGSAELLQAKLNDLSRKARLGRHKDFTASDRAVLWLGFRAMVAGGYAHGYNGAAIVLDHYLSASGKDLVVDPAYFRSSPVIIKILRQHYQSTVLEPNRAKHTTMRINPPDYGWLDANLRYMMNPFTLFIRDSLARNMITSGYRVECRIAFDKNTRTYFFLPGDTIVFPDNLGVVLESLGMGKPFNLNSTWQDIHYCP